MIIAIITCHFLVIYINMINEDLALVTDTILRMHNSWGESERTPHYSKKSGKLPSSFVLSTVSDTMVQTLLTCLYTVDNIWYACYIHLLNFLICSYSQYECHKHLLNVLICSYDQQYHAACCKCLLSCSYGC